MPKVKHPLLWAGALGALAWTASRRRTRRFDLGPVPEGSIGGPGVRKGTKSGGAPSQPPVRRMEPGELGTEGSVAIKRVDNFACAKARKQPMPDVNKLMPQQLQAAGGPIVQAIVAGTSIVKQIFDAVGPAKVCTVRGGELRALEVVADVDQAVSFWVGVSVAFEGHEEAGWWTFESQRGSTGEIVQRDAYKTQEGPKNTYLFEGDEPPGDLWPHVNLPKWRRWVPEELDRPRAAVVRTGDDLTLTVWVPPRAPLSHTNVWGKRIIDAPVVWTVQWAIKR